MQPQYRDGRDYVEVPRELHKAGKLNDVQSFLRSPESRATMIASPLWFMNLPAKTLQAGGRHTMRAVRAGGRLLRVSPGRAFPKGLGVMADDQVRGVVAGQLASIGSIRGAHGDRPQTLFFFQVIVIKFEFDQLVGDGL